MKYSVNSATLFGAFSLPTNVVDKHIKMAGAAQLKTLLYIFRNPQAPIDAEEIAEYLSVPTADIYDCLAFWADAGLLLADGKSAEIPTPSHTEKRTHIRPAAQKPDRAEVARRGNENAEIAFMLRETQAKLGRTLRQSEASTLVWLHDDEGMSVSVILMVIEFAISDGKANIGYIERTALDWLDCGVQTPKDAEDKISEIFKNRSYFAVMRRAFGLPDRLPGKKETEYSKLWVGEWKLSSEILRAAYEICVDNTGKYQLPYIAKILADWHSKGIKNTSDIPSDTPEKKKSFATYDRSLIDSMLSSIDEE